MSCAEKKVDVSKMVHLELMTSGVCLWWDYRHLNLCSKEKVDVRVVA